MKSSAEHTKSSDRAVHLGVGSFCSQLSASALRDLQSYMVSVVYPEDAVLFEEQEPLRGVFVLTSGLVKLSVGSAEGKNLILRLVRPGSVIGLSASVSGHAYGNQAKAVHRCEAGFVAAHPEAYEAICRELVSQQSGALEQLRIVTLSGSVPERLAKLLLDWSETGQATKEGIRVKMPLTHGEIGEFIGTTRETVSRTLGQ